MQYRIYCDDYLLYDSQNESYQVLSPKLKQELNAVDELTFTIYPNHVYFDRLNKLSSIVTMYRDSTLLFKGRILNDKQGFNNEKQVTCEGSLAFLLDSIQRPFDFPNDEQFEDYIEATNVIHYFLNWALTNHNNQVADHQKIYLGNVTVTDPNNYISYSSIEYLSTWEVIKTRLLDNHGGYLSLRYTDSGTYLDYLEDFTSDGTKTGYKLISSQIIKFAENLLDISQEVLGEEIKTGIIPLGKRLEDAEGQQTDEYLTIEDLDDGAISDDIIKSGDYILNTTLATKYGKIFEVVKWEDVSDPTNLKNKAVNYLADSVKFTSTIELKAIDLNLTNNQVGAFKTGEYIGCSSQPHKLNAIYLLEKIDMDIKNPQNTSITLGDSKLTLTDIQMGTATNTSDLIERIDRVERGYTNNGAISAIIAEKIENSSVIEQTSEEIMTKVEELYVKQTELETYKNDVSTQLTQTNDSFNFQFSNITELINNVSTETSNQYNEIIKYIRFEDGNIILGVVGNDLILKMNNEKISFLQNNIEVAYFNSNKLYITDTEILNSLQLGNFSFFPRSSGNLSLKKIK